jgi:hypothetical protein
LGGGNNYLTNLPKTPYWTFSNAHMIYSSEYLLTSNIAHWVSN